MKFTKALVSLLATLAVAAPAAQAVTIGFEDIGTASCCAFLPAGYQGFQWSGGYDSSSWVVSSTANSFFDGISAHSGDHFAWSNGGVYLTLSGSPFTLDSLWVREALNISSVTLTGLTGGLQTYSESFLIGSDYQQLKLNFVGIDQLLISSGSRNILLDDIVVTTNAVPEPATGASILLGLGLMAFMRRRAKAK